MVQCPMMVDQPYVLILAAGLGTRLGPATRSTPKCLVPVAGQSPLDRWFRLLEPLGATDVFVNTHRFADQIAARLSVYDALGPARWHERPEPELLGTAGTVRSLVRELPDDADLLVIYADNISELDPADFVEHFRDLMDAAACVGLFHAPNPSQCGIARCDGAGRILSFVEKPASPESDLANAGVLIAPVAELRDGIEAEDVDLSSDVLPRLTGRMHGHVLPGYHQDMGTPEALAAIERDLVLGRWRRREAVIGRRR